MNRAVGRYTRYFSAGGQTVVWAQDGTDAEIKLYVDALNPLGRAEAVALGANLPLKGFPGAAHYRVAHRALLDGQWSAAIAGLEKVLATKQGSPMLVAQARYILAMAIAADVKEGMKTPRSASWKTQSRLRIKRAITLAPSLKRQLEGLAKGLY